MFRGNWYRRSRVKVKLKHTKNTLVCLITKTGTKIF